MKRSAVLGHTLAIALATAAAGVALAAGPASADETSQLALAPLPQVLTGTSLFGQVKQGEPKGEQKGEEKGEGEEGGGKKGQCRDDWRSDHVNYRFHPVGYVLEKNTSSLTDLTPNYPNGFVAKHFNQLELSRGLGGGLEVGISAAEAREFGLKAGAVLNPHPHDSVWFFGGYMQKKLVSEKGLLPTISIGGRVNQGDDELLSYGVYLVGTKRILGKPCQTPGAWITSGYKWDGYTTDTEEGLTLAEITPVGRPVPGLDNNGARPSKV